MSRAEESWVVELTKTAEADDSIVVGISLDQKPVIRSNKSLIGRMKLFFLRFHRCCKSCDLCNSQTTLTIFLAFSLHSNFEFGTTETPVCVHTMLYCCRLSLNENLMHHGGVRRKNRRGWSLPQRSIAPAATASQFG